MHFIVFGATGRVGTCFTQQALLAGHKVTAYVRDRTKAPQGVFVIVGDVMDAGNVDQALHGGCDAVIMCIGAGALKPSTVVTQAMTTIVAAMRKAGIARLLAVSGTAEMPEKTWMGHLYTRLLRLTPVGHAVRDHDGAYAAVKGSALSWVLAGCNYIASGPAKGRYQTATIFPGGFKMIRPGDVARFLLAEAERPQYDKKIIGIWY
jgi:uncharacterized protein